MSGNVYVGTWNNWGEGYSKGPTLTVPVAWGNVIISFLAIYVSYASTHFWGIVSFIVHQSRADTRSRDGLYHQQQAILRNSPTDMNALAQFLKVAWHWREATNGSLRRSAPLGVLALIHFLLFYVAGLSSSTVIGSSDVVLLRSDRCGWIEDFPQMLRAFTGWQPNARQLDVLNAVSVHGSWSYRRSAAYARACYAEESGSYAAICNTYPSRRLSSTFNSSSSGGCPFPGKACTTGLLVMDSGNLDSDRDFGLNAREKDRLFFRRVTSAVPIDTDKYATNWTTPPPELLAKVEDAYPYDVLKLYMLGKNLLAPPETPFTFFTRNSSQRGFSKAYELKSLKSFANNINDPESIFVPIPELIVKDADLTLLFLASKAEYSQRVQDPWFRGETNKTTMRGFFGPNNILSTLAILEQFQICISPKTKCTPLTGLNQLLPNSTQARPLLQQMNPVQRSTYDLLWNAAKGTQISLAAFFLSDEILLAKNALWSNGLLSAGLPPNQWEQEAKNMHNISLALMQRRMVEHAAQPAIEIRPGKLANEYTLPPSGEYAAEARELCQQQRSRDPTYASFNLVGLIAVVVLGGVVTAVNLSLPRVVASLQEKYRLGESLRLAWIESGFLQLQRIACETYGIGPWARKEKEVPVTMEFAKRFAIPVGRQAGRERGGDDVDLGLLPVPPVERPVGGMGHGRSLSASNVPLLAPPPYISRTSSAESLGYEGQLDWRPTLQRDGSPAPLEMGRRD